jgi:rhodanese-related sulfurtransferase
VEPWIAVAALAAAVLAVRLARRKAPMEDVKAKLSAGATVVDVRSPGEFRAAAYRGARNIPLPELGARLAEIPRDRPVVLYCASGARSALAASVLRRAGFADVVNAGGLADLPR